MQLHSNFIEITFRHGCSTVNLLHIFRTPIPKSTSEWLLLKFSHYPIKMADIENLENFVSFSQFVNLFFYLHSHFERIFSILQFTRLLDSIGLCWFSDLCNSKLDQYIYTIYYILAQYIYTIDAHLIHFRFCNLIALPSLLEQCYILMQ